MKLNRRTMKTSVIPDVIAKVPPFLNSASRSSTLIAQQRSNFFIRRAGIGLPNFSDPSLVLVVADLKRIWQAYHRAKFSANGDGTTGCGFAILPGPVIVSQSSVATDSGIHDGNRPTSTCELPAQQTAPP